MNIIPNLFYQKGVWPTFHFDGQRIACTHVIIVGIFAVVIHFGIAGKNFGPTKTPIISSPFRNRH